MRDHSVPVHTADSVLPAAWPRITRAPRRLLLLDYDGTLAPLHVARDRAVPSRRMRDALRAVASMREPVVVISGRPLSQLLELLHGIPVHLIGEHGWEELTPDGRRHVHELPRTTAARLGLAHRAAVASGWEPCLEAKRCSVVLHTRVLHRERAAELEHDARDLWERYFERDGLRLDVIDGGLELRATQRGKGSAAWELLRGQPQGTLPVYLGDDVSDEEAFRLFRPLGVTVRIGRPHLPTAAEWRLGSVEDVESFLSRWHAAVPGPVS
jgi:trehalose 6-phosphate phosphatase